MADPTQLLDHLPAWLLVLFRLSGIFLLAPIFGSMSIPAQIKVFLVFGLSLCVYPMLLDSGRPSAGFVEHVVDNGLSFWTLIPCIAMEMLIGYAIGFAASLPLMGMQIGGHVIDQQIGLGIAGVLNPELGEQSGIVGELFFTLALAIFAILGGHRILLATLVSSFDYVPLGGFTQLEATVGMFLGVMTVMLELALKIAAPLLCLVFLETLAMGFIARTMPQMNIMSIGFSLRIMIGVGLLVGLLTIIAGVYIDSTRLVLHQLAAFFGG